MSPQQGQKRTLDRLAQADPERVYAQVALRAVVAEDVERGGIYAEATWAQGSYEQGDDPIHLTRGYSKNHRPGVSSFLLGLGVTPDSIPVIGQNWGGDTAEVF